MVSCLSLCLVLLVVGNCLSANGSDEFVGPGPLVDDDITTNTTWDVSGSPYIIERMIRVIEGVTLTVREGVEVRFSEDGGLVIDGRLDAGGEGVDTYFGPKTGTPDWKGLLFDGTSTCCLESVLISYAKTGMDLNSSGPVWVRNCTFSSVEVPLRLRNGSVAVSSNSTLVWDSVSFEGLTSYLRTFSYLKGLTVDHAGTPRGGLRVEVTDRNDDLLLSYLVNQTGEVPPLLLEGFTLTGSGYDRANGTYALSISDDPFTHFINMTLEHNGSSQSKVVWRFSWPPALTKVPASMNVIEDHPTYYPTEILDRNKVGSVDIMISSPNVTYDQFNRALKFHYRNETVKNETVEIILGDGYDETNYMFDVNVTFWPDSPTIDVANRFIHVTEDMPVFIKLHIEDEDTPIGDLSVMTEDYLNITYLPDNTTLKAVFPDGARSQFNVNVSVFDGWSEAVKELVFLYTGVFFPPQFVGLPQELVLKEDEQLLFDLSPFIKDPDKGDQVYLKADSKDLGLFSCGVISDQLVPGSGEFTLLISPEMNAYGTGHVSMRLSDGSGLNTTVELTIRISPVNDAPMLDSARVEPMEGGTYRFLVAYYDVDGDPPVDLYVAVDGTRLPMTGSDDTDTDVKDGKFYMAITELEAGEHSYSFIGSDGNITRTLDGGLFTTPEVLRYDELRGYEGRLGISTVTVGKGPSPSLTTAVGIAGNVAGMVMIGCSFRVDVLNRTLSTMIVRVDILDFRDDIIAQTSRLYRSAGGTLVEESVPYYNRSTGMFTASLDSKSVGSNLSIWAELDPDLDPDGDGVPNFLDAFPEDPTEWNDTDHDGQGDNTDLDDDNDGFPDLLEIGIGTNPRTAASYPKDTDSDGTLDFYDEDDDDDGMPDTWEMANLLDPLDPRDAGLDPDGDGLTSLEEYRDGTDPNFDDRKDDEGIDAPWVLLIAVIAAILLISAAILIVRTNRRPSFELNESDAEAADEEWEVRGELDRDDAVECPKCNEYYPYWNDRCPFCGRENPMEEGE